MDPKLRRTVIRISAGLVVAVILIWLMMWLESVTTMLMVAFIFAYVLDPRCNDSIHGDCEDRYPRC